MTKFKVLIVLILTLNFTSFSQQYKTAIGLKGGSMTARSGFGGVNLKHFFTGSNAIEITASGGRGNYRIHGLYEWQNQTGWEEGLDWYVGIGGGAGFWRRNYWAPGHNKYGLNDGFYLFGSAVIGLDYTFSDLPLNLAIDTGPSVGIINTYGFGWGGGIAIRYILE